MTIPTALTPQDSILVSLVAATDGIWLPSRECHDGGSAANAAVTNCYELRKQFGEFGLSWASGETTDAGRKQKQRAVEDMSHKGLVTCAKPGLTKTIFVKLTDGAYDHIRQRCGLPSIEIGFQTLKLVAAHSKRPAKFMQDIWIPEPELNGGRGWGDGNHAELYDVAQRALPALVAGWLKTNCDSSRRVYYNVTATGWRLLDDGWKPDPIAVSPLNEDIELAYYERLATERAKLTTRTPDQRGELGWLAINTSHHNVPIYQAEARVPIDTGVTASPLPRIK